MSTETPLEFTKLSEVERTETLSSEDTILIEHGSEIKRITKDKVGAQADWNETDETSLSFIKNKPDVKDGYVHIYGGYQETFAYGYDESTYAYSNTLTAEEVYDLYTTKPIMFHRISMYGKQVGMYPIISHSVGSDETTHYFYFASGTSISSESISE